MSVYPSTAVITKTLCELGFRNRSRKVDGITQYKDFSVKAITNSTGERIRTYVQLYSHETEKRIYGLKDVIESRTNELGVTFTVDIRPYGHVIIHNG